jgi:transcriptional regulator with XRE-family HTH domain
MKNDIYLQQIGTKVKVIRKSQNISLRELGKLCDIDFGHLSRLENGTQNVHILTLKNIADVLKVDVRDFI